MDRVGIQDRRSVLVRGGGHRRTAGGARRHGIAAFQGRGAIRHDRTLCGVARPDGARNPVERRDVAYRAVVVALARECGVNAMMPIEASLITAPPMSPTPQPATPKIRLTGVSKT